MLLITCPHCGPRDESEFSYGGARRIWPDHDANLDQTETAMQDWHQTLYLSSTPSNPSGPLTEIWYHGGGVNAGWKSSGIRKIIAYQTVRKATHHEPCA